MARRSFPLLSQRARSRSSRGPRRGSRARCMSPTPIRAAPSRPVSDAHAHFFNASDLPVRSFLRNVIAPAWFPDLPGIALALGDLAGELARSEEHTSELQSLMRISYAVFCLKKKKTK